MNNYIEAWLANNGGRGNNISLQIQKNYIQMLIDGKDLQIPMPHNFYTNFPSGGIISNTDCAFIGTLTNADESNSMHTASDLMIILNDKIKRFRSCEFYSFSSIVFEKYKISSTECDGEAPERDDGEGYAMALGTTGNEGQLMNGYFDELIEDANKRCEGARSVGMPINIEVPGSQNIQDDILRWCKVYSFSHNKWCVGFEVELTGILSDYSRHRHGHVYEALGFSFATPLVIEITFQPLGDNFENTSLEAQGVSLSEAFQGLSAMHRDMELKVPPMERKFVYSDGDQDDLYQQLGKLIDLSKSNPMHLYGLRSLLPRIAKDFFSRGGRDRDPNVLLAGEDNIFVRFLLFTGNHLASLLKRCIVCDKELLFTVSRLCSCADELCLFGFEVLGLGAQVLQELVRMPVELIDLEISLAFAAAKGSRDVFEPFPPFLLKKREICQRSRVLNHNHIENLTGNPRIREIMRKKRKHMDDLSSIMGQFPPISEMRLCADESELKAKLGTTKLGTDIYKVLRFILSANRPSLVFLSDDDDKLLKPGNSWYLSGMLYQFAVVQDSPETEVAYTNRHEVSRFGFHGSCRENWYSILRNGLRCLSNTKLMSGGRSLGDGIYLADSFACSARYALPPGYEHPGWFNSRYKDYRYYVVGICEAISSPLIREVSGKWVVPKASEGSVAVRYLLVCHSLCNSELTAHITDGHILCHNGHSVDLFKHHRNIRRKYASIS